MSQDSGSLGKVTGDRVVANIYNVRWLPSSLSSLKLEKEPFLDVRLDPRTLRS